MQLSRSLLLALCLGLICGFGCSAPAEPEPPASDKQTQRTNETTNKTDDGQPIMGR